MPALQARPARLDAAARLGGGIVLAPLAGVALGWPGKTTSPPW
ncbi:MAG TPA: hypothetical protein VEM33_07870 [Burkholderiales bacterium]|nr:hypothetical protein [Burkholderiales bacterium]